MDATRNGCDYLPTCEETKCYGRRVDGENGVGPSFPVSVPTPPSVVPLLGAKAFRLSGVREFSLILEGKI